MASVLKILMHPLRRASMYLGAALSSSLRWHASANKRTTKADLDESAAREALSATSLPPKLPGGARKALGYLPSPS
jgi:hypothetical protein